MKKYGKTAVFSGGLRPDWGNMGSEGLIVLVIFH